MIPKLAVAIPTYNRAPILDDILWNLGPQITRSTPNVVLYVIDNDSTDNTAAVVAEHAARWGGIHYLKNEKNVGLIRNIAAAIRLPEAKWVWLMGDDDIPVPWAVTSLLDEIEALRNPDGISLLMLNGAKVDAEKLLCPESWQHVEGFGEEITEFDRGAEIIRVGGIHCLAWLSKLVVQRSHWDQAYFDKIYRETDLYTFVHVLLHTGASTQTAYSKRLFVMATDTGSRSYYHSKTAIARVCEFPEIERLIIENYGPTVGHSFLAAGRKGWLGERFAFALKIAVFDEEYVNQLRYLKDPVSPFPAERFVLRGVYLLTRIRPLKAALRRYYLRRRGKSFSAESINQAC